jgi:heptaprenyl diphosphate synthase
MCVVKKYIFPKISVIGMSVIGAAVHNVTQILVSGTVFASVYIFSYLPMLLIVAVLSGVTTGYFAQILVKRIEKE